MKKLLLALVLSAPAFLLGQEKPDSTFKSRVVETIACRAKVLGVFENSSRLAVLKVINIETPNNFEIKVGDELLTEFYFSVKPVEGSSKMTGIKTGDKISVRLTAKEEAATGQMKYIAFDYSKVKPKEAAKAHSTLQGRQRR